MEELVKELNRRFHRARQSEDNSLVIEHPRSHRKEAKKAVLNTLLNHFTALFLREEDDSAPFAESVVFSEMYGRNILKTSFKVHNTAGIHFHGKIAGKPVAGILYTLSDNVHIGSGRIYKEHIYQALIRDERGFALHGVANSYETKVSQRPVFQEAVATLHFDSRGMRLTLTRKLGNEEEEENTEEVKKALESVLPRLQKDLSVSLARFEVLRRWKPHNRTVRLENSKKFFVRTFYPEERHATVSRVIMELLERLLNGSKKWQESLEELREVL